MKLRFRVERRAFEVETRSILPRMDDSCSVGRECVFILDVTSFHGCLSSRFLLHFLTLFFVQDRHHTNFRLSSPSLLSKYFRHQKAKEAREEILERHGPEVSPQPKVLQEAQ